MRSDTIRRIGNWVKLLLVIAACLLFAFFIRRNPEPPGERPPDISLKAGTDTLTIHDTIYVPTPQLAATSTLGFANITLPIWRPTFTGEREEQPAKSEPAPEDEAIDTEPPDSVTVQIPIEQRHYKGDDYDAWVSGWKPTLDSLRIYRTTQHLTTTNEITRWKTRHWGLSVGTGAVVTPKGTISPGIFIGASYTFLAF